MASHASRSAAPQSSAVIVTMDLTTTGPAGMDGHGRGRSGEGPPIASHRVLHRGPNCRRVMLRGALVTRSSRSSAPTRNECHRPGQVERRDPEYRSPSIAIGSVAVPPSITPVGAGVPMRGFGAVTRRRTGAAGGLRGRSGEGRQAADPGDDQDHTRIARRPGGDPRAARVGPGPASGDCRRSSSAWRTSPEPRIEFALERGVVEIGPRSVTSRASGGAAGRPGAASGSCSRAVERSCHLGTVRPAMWWRTIAARIRGGRPRRASRIARPSAGASPAGGTSTRVPRSPRVRRMRRTTRNASRVWMVRSQDRSDPGSRSWWTWRSAISKVVWRDPRPRRHQR
jgi:hypothetical protein